jgi:dTDP-4-dehydrorhamnose reductase
LTLRTSIIGPEITGFTSLVAWFLGNAGGRVKGFSRAIYSGITTREMVNVVDFILSDKPHMRGLYQVASSPISKYELLNLLAKSLNLSTEIDKESDFALDRSMSADLFSKATGYSAPDWPSMISGLSSDLREYWANGWNTQLPAEAFKSGQNMPGDR